MRKQNGSATSARRKNENKRRQRRFYAVPCMIAMLVMAALLTGAGRYLRVRMLEGLPQYNDAPDIAIPMMLLQDSGPLREARERAAWEKEQGEAPMIEAIGTADEAAPAEPEAVAAQPEAPVEPAAPETPVEPEALDAPQPEDEAVAALASVNAAPAEQPLLEEELLVQDAPVPEAEPLEAGSLPAWLDTAENAAPEVKPLEITESFFDHTLFIGDSKTDGMRMWARLGKAHYFCGTSYSVYNIFDKKTSDETFKDAKLDSVLKKNRYDQIYILLGYNECGYPLDSLMKQFKYVIGRVHEAQPQARIILHGIMHASERVARKYDYYTVTNIERVNDGLRELAASYDGLYYVDCNEAFCDDEGYLLGKTTTDGEHLTPEYTRQWAQEILKRAVLP